MNSWFTTYIKNKTIIRSSDSNRQT